MDINKITDDMLYEVVSEICSPNELGLVYLHYYKGVSLTMSSAASGRSHYSYAKVKLDNVMSRINRYLYYRQCRAFVYYFIHDLLSSLWKRNNSKEFSIMVSVIFMLFMGYSREIVKEKFGLTDNVEYNIRYRVRSRMNKIDLDFFSKQILDTLM